MRCVKGLDQSKKALEIIATRTSSETQQNALQTVETILKEIQEEGDHAVIKYTEKFDRFRPEPFNVPKETIKRAWNETPLGLQKALKLAHLRIEEFHQRQLPKDVLLKGVHGEKLGRRWRPVKKAGIYIPGGRAAYPSTVLMNAIPAQVAGVKNIVMVSPANQNGEINSVVLAAAHLAGVNQVLRIGGAQSIGALAYGTETIERVDVISGPGNIYVTLAKKSVYGKVGIDSLAGPSEVVIIADGSAQIKQIAADLLAQAEHDPLAAAILITTEASIVEALPQEIESQLTNHPRAETCKDSLNNWGLIVICENIDECIELADYFAPEHLELLTEEPQELANKINNAGAIFIGQWSPEAVGDYLAGPNHTLPTSGTARFSGALGVETFMKNTSLIEFNKKAFDSTSKEVIDLATSEGLYSHAESIKIRI